jgi:hypothetical protein
MTKDELIRELTELDVPGDTMIVMSKDAEGNDHSPLADLSLGMYDAESTWAGEVYMTDEAREASGMPDEYGEAPDTAVPALVLCPVN